MNVIEISRTLVDAVSQHPILERLLLASLEFAVLALVMGGSIWLGRINWPRLTAILWLLVLAKPLVSLLLGSPLCLVQIPPLETSAAMRPIVVESVAPQSAISEVLSMPDAKTRSSLEGDIADTIAANPTPAVEQPAGLRPSKSVAAFAWLWANAASILIAVWSAGVIVFSARAIVGRYLLRKIVASARSPGDALTTRYVTMASSLGIRRIPRLVVTDELESPAIAGVISPVVLIPAWLTPENTSVKLEWAIKHELMHWRLLDPLANFVRELAQILFHFHPAVWWVGRKWEEAAELACDRAIVASEADSRDYAEQLYQMLVVVCDHRRLRLSTGLFATRTQIGRRIAALLAAPLTVPSRLNALAIAAILVVSVMTLSVGIGFAQKAAPHDDPLANSAKAAGSKPQSEEPIAVVGQILDPDSKPLAGARLQLEYYRITQPNTEYGPSYSTTSGPDGQFRFDVPRAELAKASRADYWTSARVVAMREGYGFDEQQVPKVDAAQRLELQLVNDVPIDGRILDIEGRPVVGANLHVKTVRWSPGVNLDSFVAESREGRNPYGFKRSSNRRSFGRAPLVTDSDGRFTLAGIGAERVVRFDVEGPAIAYGSIEVVTREMQAAIISASSPLGQQRLYGAKFEHISPPSRTIRGTVRDRATGQPIAGAAVHGRSNHMAKTDEAGRYELLGSPKSPQYDLQLFPPDGQAYFRAVVTISDTPGLEPLEKDVQLSSGTIVRGRLTDQRTGQPIVGRVEYHPLFPNEYVAKLERASQPASVMAIQSDGQFAISVFPGPGVLGFKSDGIDDSEYAPAVVSAEELKQLFQGTSYGEYNEGFLQTAAGGQASGVMSQAAYRALVLINPSEGQESLTKDVVFEPSPKVRGTLVGPDGQPLLGATVFGLPPSVSSSKSLKTADFEVQGLNPKRPHSLLFTHEEHKLGATLTVRGDEAEPLTVRLQPLGSASGRLLNLEGEAVPNTTLDFCRARLYGPGVRTAKTDADGRFQVDGLATGQKYDAILWWPRSPAAIRVARLDVSVEPGETKDLGDVRVMTK